MKRVNKSTGKAEQVRKLVSATGMTRCGVYRCLREKRLPSNPILRRAWERALAAAKAKVGAA